MSLRGKDEPLPETVKFVKNEEGRVFIATPALRQRPDMTACDKDGRIIAVKQEGQAAFVLAKAPKQRIIDEAKHRFGVDLTNAASGVKALRNLFKELENDHASKNDN